MSAPRYTEYPFPRIRYIPGKAIHPSKDPDRPTFKPDDAERFSAAAWWENQTYLFGVDLFNFGFWWEAHEVFEEVWLAVGRSTELGQTLQGVIFLCGALVKVQTGQQRVAQEFLAKAADRLTPQRAQSLGIDAADLLQQVGQAVAQARTLLPQVCLQWPKGQTAGRRG